jgi:hypothetical protein
VIILKYLGILFGFCLIILTDKFNFIKKAKRL